MRRMRVFVIAAIVAAMWCVALTLFVKGIINVGGLRCVALVVWEGKLPEGCAPQ